MSLRLVKSSTTRIIVSGTRAQAGKQEIVVPRAEIKCLIFEKNFVERMTGYWMVGDLGKMCARGFGAIIWKTGAT